MFNFYFPIHAVICNINNNSSIISILKIVDFIKTYHIELRMEFGKIPSERY